MRGLSAESVGRPWSEPTDILVLSDGAPNVLEGPRPDRRFYTVSRLELHVYKTPKTAIGAAIVFVGGGYLDLVYDKEGVETVQWLNVLGIDAYIVVHRLPGANGAEGEGPWPYDIALTDARTCAQFVEGQTALPVVYVGLSSGGHLAGTLACQSDIRPPAGVLMAYAPLNANHSRYKAPGGKPDYPPIEKQRFYDAWPIGIAAEPHGVPTVPAFLAYALHDQPVPIDHALNFIKAMHAVGGDVEAHIFPQAPHGFAFRDLDGTHAQWPMLAERWMQRFLPS